MNTDMKKPELLAPVGSPEALVAAVRCGADAVYLGAGRFHARQHSTPFDEAAFRDTVAYCHEFGVDVHMTLNTLIREDEFSAALEDAHRAADLGVDALIVQDRGLAAAIHRAAPSLALHASTQLSCHTAGGVKMLADEGFSRVVLAREMTKEEIAACCQGDCEIETFVHGALCMSVSGQCFLSAALGGRSGNRGRCAQPCRLPFCVGNTPKDTDRALSLKDLSLLQHVRELAALGVDSLKIEGRMKRPEYVAAAVSVCRAAIDGTPIDDTLLDDLQSVFSRSGFTDGYFANRRDRAMFGSRTKDDVVGAPAAQKRLRQLFHKGRPRVGVSASLTLRRNTPMTLTLCDHDGNKAVAVGEIPTVSDTPLSAERLRDTLGKLGNTPFFVEETAIDRDDLAGAPLSTVNALRREAAQMLREQRRTPVPVPFADIPLAASQAPTSRPDRPSVVVRLQHHSQLSDTVCRTADLLVLPLDTPCEILKATAASVRVAVEIPRGLFGSEHAAQSRLLAAKPCGVVAAVCHTVDAVALCHRNAVPVIGGFGLHIFNKNTLQVHQTSGLTAATLSFELSAKQQRFARSSALPYGVIAYGHLPLMLLRNCPAKAALGCKTCRQNRSLTDRKGVRFPIVCQNGCADLLNSVPLFLGDKLHDLPSPDFITLHMTIEDSATVAAVCTAFRNAVNGTPIAPPKDGFTRGLTFKGVE